MSPIDRQNSVNGDYTIEPSGDNLPVGPAYVSDVNSQAKDVVSTEPLIPHRKIDKGQAIAAFNIFLESLGFEPEKDPHMAGTAERVFKLYRNELFRGMYEAPPSITQFESTDDDQQFYDQMIYSGPITVRSTCSHHFLPIVGEAHVGIILQPDSPLPGLSKYARIVHYFASRPQVQERLTQDICSFLNKTLKPAGVGIVIRAKHFCQCHRGVHENDAQMITSDLRGNFRVPAVRNEFLHYVDMNTRGR